MATCAADAAQRTTYTPTTAAAIRAYPTKVVRPAPLGVSVADAAVSEIVELGFSTSKAPVGTEADDVEDQDPAGLEVAVADPEALGLLVSPAPLTQ